ncbi:methylcobalamin:coenzyme M methyltransferase [Methylomusa anaerophila]|uniref:Methylcobalamin:coenzyme M methyltransferase n=2 Tax=Methylomusa anaerophila TaxID=1930071 RepID=A0A348AJN3_9FIRM|nr:methylcobalamin:coenzyme M methyltransferase [Methylomusa anaerophila]
MDHLTGFTCQGETPEEIPLAFVRSVGKNFYDAHTDRNTMAAIARQKMLLHKDCLCKVPFCVTVEAEALGAKVTILDDKIGPRFSGYKFTRLEQLQQLTGMDLGSGRISEVLHGVEILKNTGQTVVLNVEGPFTILGMLIDQMNIYKGFGKYGALIQQVLKVIEDSIVEYMAAGIEKGAKIISYADPSGGLDIIGPRLYAQLSGNTTCSILKRIENQLDGVIVHLCGRTSSSLIKAGLCTVKPVEVGYGLTYGEMLCRLLPENKIKFLGQNCLKSTPVYMQNPVVWQLELT